MKIDVEQLFSGKTPSALSKRGHKISISVVGWGEPPTYYVECSCGWEGRTVHSDVPELLIEPLRELQKIHGPEAILGPDDIFGDARTATREALAHLNLPLEERIEGVQKKITKFANALDMTKSWDLNNSGKLQNYLADLDVLVTVQAFIAVEPVFARKTPFDPAVYAEYKRAINIP